MVLARVSEIQRNTHTYMVFGSWFFLQVVPEDTSNQFVLVSFLFSLSLSISLSLFLSSKLLEIDMPYPRDNDSTKGKPSFRAAISSMA